jgi:hypothetical protein
MGHVHEMYHLLSVADGLEHNSSTGYRTVQRVRHHIRTSSYKNESSGSGYHDEKGRPAKPLGGYWMRLTVRERAVNKVKSIDIEPEFTMAL